MVGKNLVLWLVAPVLILFCGCARSPGGTPAAATADAKIDKSFHILKGSNQLGLDDKEHIVIARSALDKEFLFQPSLIPQVGASEFKALKSRIVTFHLHGDKLEMLAANQGLTDTSGVPNKILLTVFPLKDPAAAELVFDFNAGTSLLLTEGDDAASDEGGATYDSDDDFAAHQVPRSYLDGSHFDASNRLVIRQIAQVEGEGALEPREIRYYLSPYRPNPGFKPLQLKQTFKRYGFFETQPQLDGDGQSILYASHWDASKKVVYAVSANTPPAYRQAVKEGILYWNKVLGRDFLQVVDAPAGVSAPDSDLNIVQWISDKTTGYAYADEQQDPRTGEILHAQIFLPSSWAIYTRDQARAAVRGLRTRSKALRSEDLGLRGFEDGTLCHFELGDRMRSTLEALLLTDLSDAAILKLSNDQIREVVAHEVGHTLGLRHDFAASLATNYPLAQRQQMVAQFFNQQKAADGIVVANSVMDYNLNEDEMIIGDQIQNGKVLDYDQKAIATLYSGAQIKNEDWPIYCTDSGVGAYFDCQRFDAGSSAIEFGVWQENEQLNALPNALINNYIRSQTEVVTGNPTSPADELALTPNPERILGWRRSFLAQYTKRASMLKIKSQYPIVAAFNMDVVQDAQLQYLRSEIDRLGGVSAILSQLPEDFVSTSVAKLERLLTTVYQTGVGYDDRNYLLSDDDIKVIKAHARLYFSKYEKEHRLLELKILTEAGTKSKVEGDDDDSVMGTSKINAGSTSAAEDYKLTTDPLVDELGSYFNQRACDTILATTGQFITASVTVPLPEDEDNDDDLKTIAKMTPAPTTLKKTVKLPIFKESLEMRLLATSLSNESRSHDKVWNVTEKYRLHHDLGQLVISVFGVKIDRLTPQDMPDPAARWVIEVSKVMKSLCEGDGLGFECPP